MKEKKYIYTILVIGKYIIAILNVGWLGYIGWQSRVKEKDNVK